MNIFEFASKNKLRFASARGMLTVEDLWDLPLSTTKQNGVSLDTIAVDLYHQTKTDAKVSFVEDVVSEDTAANVAFEIVKHIIVLKKAENAAARAESERRAKKQLILQAMAERQTSDLKAMSMEELQKAFAEL